MFEHFEAATLHGDGSSIFVRRKGEGAPLLLLHGFPETHLMWHAIAPALAQEFSVVCADLRGYGASGKPMSSDDHAPYAKRAMGQDMIAIMEELGFPRFSVAGHDRGGRVAYRMALDFPDRIERLAVLDIVPTSEAFGRADARFALGYWPWLLLAQPAPLPERLIGGDPAALIDNALMHWGTNPSSFPPELKRAYIEALNSEAVHAICEEFRAAATLDVANDEADRAAGHRIACPTLALWGKGGPLDTWYSASGGPLRIWQDWAQDASGHAIEGGHFFPEQNAEETKSALRAFFRTTGALAR